MLRPVVDQVNIIKFNYPYLQMDLISMYLSI